MAADVISWTAFSEADKELCRSLRATLVLAPREMSGVRLVDLIKEQLEKRNVIFGVAEEVFTQGFEDQPQFKMLALSAVDGLAQKINAAKLPHRLQVLAYPQQAVDEVIRATRPNNVVVVRGSYQFPFHRSSTCALLERRGIGFTYVSPFVHEQEAQEYYRLIEPTLPEVGHVSGNETAMFTAAMRIARRSFDYSFQTGAVLAEKTEDGYSLVDAACNEVVPYQTYALHNGNAREDNRTAHQAEAAHYDTIHAEMNLLVRAMKHGTNFAGKSLFINMMPCPNCARTLVTTGLQELVYHHIHSDGYAADLFEKAGITTRKVSL